MLLTVRHLRKPLWRSLNLMESGVKHSSPELHITKTDAVHLRGTRERSVILRGFSKILSLARNFSVAEIAGANFAEAISNSYSVAIISRECTRE